MAARHNRGDRLRELRPSILARPSPDHYEGDAGRKVSAFLRPLTREAAQVFRIALVSGRGPEPMPVSVAVVCDELYVRSALGHATDEGEVIAYGPQPSGRC